MNFYHLQENIKNCRYRTRFFLDLPLINCKIELNLSWEKDCVLSECHKSITEARFQINNVKLVITTVVMLTINDNIKFLENIRQRFKITIYWNKYRSEIGIQRKSNN